MNRGTGRGATMEQSTQTTRGRTRSVLTVSRVPDRPTAISLLTDSITAANYPLAVEARRRDGDVELTVIVDDDAVIDVTHTIRSVAARSGMSLHITQQPLTHPALGSPARPR
jgi:hypothetical protein